MRHAMRGAILVQQPPAARAMVRPRRAVRVNHATVDHLAVARRNAVADTLGHLGDDPLVALQSRAACDRKPDNTGADHQTLHAISGLTGGFFSKATWRTCLN